MIQPEQVANRMESEVPGDALRDISKDNHYVPVFLAPP